MAHIGTITTTFHKFLLKKHLQFYFADFLLKSALNDVNLYLN